MDNFTINPKNADRIFIAGQALSGGVYVMALHKSTDGGNTWTTHIVAPSSGWCHTIAIDPNNDNVIYISGYRTKSELFKSINGGSSWTEITGSIIGSVMDIAVDPVSQSRVYAGSYSGLYRSDDAGATWSKRMSNDVKCIEINHVNPAEILAGGGQGVFRSLDNGLNWTAMNDGLEILAVNSLAINPVGRLFYAGTAGGGVYRYAAADGTVPTVSTSAVSSITATSASCGGNVTSDGGSSVTARGVCWSTSANPTTADSKTTDGSGTGSFTSQITGLTQNTTYHVRAYATNSFGTAYGENRSFTTLLITYPPQITLSKTSLAFGAMAGGDKTQNQSFVITNTGGGTLDWTVADNAAWLSCSPASGTGNAAVAVSVNPTGLSAGAYSGTITVSSTTATNSPQTIAVTLNVMAAGSSTTPFGYFDTPTEGATVFGSVPVTGWALDDIEVVRVEVKRSPHELDNPIVIGPDGLVFIGNAVFVEGARPDVANLYPTYPLSSRAGWGYMLLTNMLPNYGNGPYTLYAIAYDKEGNSVTLGSKSISCNNAASKLPFGAIDTPTQGGTASGPYTNFGWALTPQPNMIPIDGSTINVWVDGVAIGRPVYNNYRSDIANKFPGYANTDGAVGYYNLDTTAYANGVHTIAWSVVDNAGNATGIGSRFFTIFNSGTAMAGVQGESLGTEFAGVQGEEGNRYRVPVFQHTPLSWAHVISLPVSFEPVAVRRGYAPEAEPELIYPDPYGVMTIEIPEVEMVEVHLGWDGSEDYAYWIQVPSGREEAKKRERLARGLGGTRAGTRTGKSGGVIYTGYMIVGDELHPLPIGSTLDPERGVFSWQPGPGFLGAYDFVFVGESANGSWKKTYIKVKIVPKF